MDFSQESMTDSLFRQSTGFCRLSFFCSILLPYIPFSMRQPLLLFTKFLELKECMSAPKNRFAFGQSQPADLSDAASCLFEKLSPLLSEQERAQFSQMQNMMQTLKLFQTFQELAPLMNMGGDGAFSPETAAAWMNMAKNGAFGTEELSPFSGFAKNAESKDAETKDMETFDAGSESNGGMSDMLLSMLSPEQKEMFENLKSVMSDEPAE